MKKKPIISSILVVGIIFSGLAFAESHRTGHGKGFGCKKYHGGSGLQMLARYQQNNLKVQVLSELTGQSEQDIQLKLKDRHMRSVMQELKIDRKAFRDALQAKEIARIKQAVADESITPEQETEILAKMAARAERREIMSRLVEKGLEEGIITRDEARLLRRR